MQKKFEFQVDGLKERSQDQFTQMNFYSHLQKRELYVVLWICCMTSIVFHMENPGQAEQHERFPPRARSHHDIDTLIHQTA